PELGPLGSVRGAFSNERSYREHIRAVTDPAGCSKWAELGEFRSINDAARGRCSLLAATANPCCDFPNDLAALSRRSDFRECAHRMWDRLDVGAWLGILALI